MTSKPHIEVTFEHDLAEFNYQVKMAKRTLLKFRLLYLWHELKRKFR